jgi:hypothetical protein
MSHTSAIQQSRQTVGASHALPLLEVPTAGHPPSKGLPTEWQRTWSALILSNPATAGDRTTLPSESYIDAQKTVIIGQPLGICEGLSKNLRLSPSQRCACLMETKEIWTTCGQQSIPSIFILGRL